MALNPADATGYYVTYQNVPGTSNKNIIVAHEVCGNVVTPAGNEYTRTLPDIIASVNSHVCPAI